MARPSDPVASPAWSRVLVGIFCFTSLGVGLSCRRSTAPEPVDGTPLSSSPTRAAAPVETNPDAPLTLPGELSSVAAVGQPAPSGSVAPSPPELWSRDQPLPAEFPSTKELSGLGLDVAVRWRDVPNPPKTPELSAEGFKEAQRRTALTWKIELAETGRMRVAFASRALPLPEGTELRLRTDRLGSLLLWPNASAYRILPVGTLRSVLGERRADVGSLVPAVPRALGTGRRLGLETRKLELTSPLGSLGLELAKSIEATEAGPLLCRLYAELAGVDLRVPVCSAGELPLTATFSWASGGGLTFEVTQLTRRTDLSPEAFLTPPPAVPLASSGLPGAPDGVFLTREELASLRSAKTEPPRSPDPAAPAEGLLAVNRTESLYYLLLDGLPVAAVPPLSERYLLGTLRGRYVRQWRTFLGEKVEPPVLVELPARLELGGAGAKSDGG